jgi:ankyrin repeat protein
MKFKIILLITLFAFNNQLIKCAAACEAIDKGSFEWEANSNSSDVNDALTQFMFKAIENDQVDEKFCKENANLINMQHPVTGTTPLMLACQLKKESIAKLFLAIDKIDLNLRDKEEKTALMHAVLTGIENLVKIVIDKNKKVLDLQDINGFSAIMHAMQKQYKPVAKLLLTYRPNMGLKTKEQPGLNANDLAVISEDPEILEMVSSVE